MVETVETTGQKRKQPAKKKDGWKEHHSRTESEEREDRPEQRARRWQRPREEAVRTGTGEEGARVQGTVLSSFATAETK